MNTYMVNETKKIIQSIIDESSGENAFDRVKDGIDRIRSFFSIILLYLLVSILVSLSLTCIIYFASKSGKASCVFFIITIPAVIGVGLFGLRHAVSNMITGIYAVITYIIELVYEYYKKMQQTPGKDIPPVHSIFQEVFTSFLLPLVKSIIRENLFGKVILFILSKAVRRFGESVNKDFSGMDLQTNSTSILTDNQGRIQEILFRLGKVNNMVKEKPMKYLKWVKTLIAIAGVLCIVLGVPLMILVIFISELIR